MKQIIKSVFPVLAFISLLFAASCSDMDDYLKYTDGKEKLYTGKVDSVKFRSGDNRIVFQGLLIADPKIVKVKVYWNMRNDSLIMDINRSVGIDTLDVSLPLSEGTYNFEVFTFDSDGNSSIAVNASGTSYGNDYKESLYNRVVKKAEKIGSDVTVDWYNGDETSPFTRIYYTDQGGEERIVDVRPSEKQTILSNYKEYTKFKMQTYFLPDEFAIDTFKTEFEYVSAIEDLTAVYIKNPGNPFLRGDSNSGKWGTLKDWQWTPNVINQESNTLGGWSTNGNPSGVIHFESAGWDGDGLTNGKIYQTMNLPAGTYTFEFSREGGSNQLEAYFVAAKGTIIPDIGDMDSSSDVLDKFKWNNSGMTGTDKIQIKLTDPETVTVGWVASFGTNTWQQIKYVKLMGLLE